MTVMRAQVVLERKTAVPADAVVNVWHFDSDQLFGDDADDLAERLRTFYQAIAGRLANTLSGNGVVKVYNMADAEPRIPGVTLPFTFVTGATALPGELAICLSFKAVDEAGANPRRRRGRVFIGPLAENTRAVDSSKPDVFVANQVRIDLTTAALALAVGPDPGDARLAIYSPTTDSAGTLDEATVDAKTIWCDDAFDVIRSRGSKSSARTVVTIP